MLQQGTTEYSDAYHAWRAKYHKDPIWQGTGFHSFNPALAVCVLTDRSADYTERVQALAIKALREATELGLVPYPNLPALRKTTEWVQEQDRLRDLGLGGNITWNQGTWRSVMTDEGYVWDDALQMEVFMAKDCKTAMCFAGHACDAAGVKWNDPGEGDDSVVKLTPKVQASFPFAEAWAQNVSTETMPIADFAEQHLSLISQEASALFHGENSARDIERIVGLIFERAGDRL